MKFSTPSQFETLQVEDIGEHILLLRLNRPAAANAITTTMGKELLTILAALEADPELYRCLILTGAGDRAFCGGADLKERQGMSDEAFRRQHHLFERMNRALTFCPIPSICAANGAAVAGGLELLLACDFAYASSTATFGFPEVSRGIMPGGGGTQQLPRAIGMRQAKELIYSAAPFSAEDAQAWGIVNRLCAPGEVVAAAIERAESICRNGPLSVRQAKKAIDLGAQMDLRSGLYVEIEAYDRLVGTDDRREGISAFNEKRPPAFKGR